MAARGIIASCARQIGFMPDLLAAHGRPEGGGKARTKTEKRNEQREERKAEHGGHREDPWRRLIAGSGLRHYCDGDGLFELKIEFRFRGDLYLLAAGGGLIDSARSRASGRS